MCRFVSAPRGTAKASLWGVGTRCLVLTLALAVVAVPVGAWRASLHPEGWTAALVAFGVVWFGFTLALILAVSAQHTPFFLHAQLGGMFFRVGLPLGTGLVLQTQNTVLAQAGIFPCLMILYLAGLVVETLLILPRNRQQAAPRGDAAVRPANGRSASGDSSVATQESASHG